MPSNSRLSRLEEKRTKRQLILISIGIILLIVLSITIGIPLLVRVSVLLGNLGGNTQITDSDTTPPFPPILNPILEATNSAQLKVDGYAEPESTLNLFLNDEQIEEVLVARDGAFSFSDITLKDGANAIYAVAKDQGGNLSNQSESQTIVYKKTGPKLEIESPHDGQTYGRNQDEIIVKGKTDPDASIRLNDRFVSRKDDGSFEYPLILQEGETTLTIIARDQAGNETKTELKVTYSP